MATEATSSARQRVTFRIDQMEIKKNPEVIGRAEWSLVAYLNDFEQWRSPEKLRGLEGDRIAVDGEFHLDIVPDTNMLKLRIEATEHDFGPDDHALGGTRLFRSLDFGGDTFYLELEGKDAELRLMMSAEIEPL